MNPRNIVDNTITVGIVIMALGLIVWGITIIRDEIAQQRWLASFTVPDPADVQKWAVLAEARRITEEAAGEQS